MKQHGILKYQCQLRCQANCSQFWSTKASSFWVNFSLLIRGIIIVHSSGRALIQFKLKAGISPALGCLRLGTNSRVGSQAFWAGIYNFSTIQLNRAIPRNCMPSTAWILNPTCENLQYSIKKNTKSVLMTGKYLRKGRVLMNTSAANQTMAKQPNSNQPTPFSIGCSKKRLDISMTIVQQPRYITKKQMMSEEHMEMQACRTMGLVLPLKMRLCMPIQGNALNAQKKPSVRPQGVSCRNSNMTAGEDMIVTQIYREVMTEATAQVNTISAMPLSRVSTLSTFPFWPGSEYENLINGALTQISVELMISLSLLLSATCTISLLMSIDGQYTHQVRNDHCSNTKVQLSNFRSERSLRSMRNREYMPVITIRLSQLTSLVFRFLYIEQYFLIFALSLLRGVLSLILSSISLAPLLSITPISSAWRVNPFSRKQFWRVCRSFLITSSPMPNTVSAAMPRIREIMYIIDQQSQALSDLFDFSAMRNKCFYTYIPAMFLISAWNLYIIRAIVSDYWFLLLFHRVLQNWNKSTPPTLPNNLPIMSASQLHKQYPNMVQQGRKISLLPNPLANLSKTPTKTTQQKYNQIHRILACDYLNGTKIGKYIEKPSHKDSRPGTHAKSNNRQSERTIGKAIELEGWDQSTLLNKFYRYPEVYEDTASRRNYWKKAENPSDSTKMRISRQCTTLWQKEHNHMPLQTQAHPRSSRRDNHQRVRPQTSNTHTLRQNKLRNQQMCELRKYKFVKMHKKSDTIEINKLREAVSQLENIAVSQFGMGHLVNNRRSTDHEGEEFDDFQESYTCKIKEIERKLREIRSCEQQAETNEEDCAVPAMLMRAFSAKKGKSTGVAALRKVTSNEYLRV